jgi:predicted kinase
VDDRIAKRIAGRLNGLADQKWCVLLAGLPGSGKTTFRKQLVALLDNDPIIVSTDDILLDVASLKGITYQQAFEEMYGFDLGREAYAQAVFAREHGRPLIIDQVNPTVKSRRKKLRWLPFSYYRVGVFCAVDRDTAAERIAKRGVLGASLKVHDNMREVFVEPTADEFDEFYTIEPTSWLVAQ